MILNSKQLVTFHLPIYTHTDPHGPNQVRLPYRNMYNDLDFSIPETGKAAIRRTPAAPKWNFLDHEEIEPGQPAEDFIEAKEGNWYFQQYMRKYFGMVKCVDHNVGKLMDLLERKGMKDNTIVIFTSDHGDMLFEHGKADKGRPYESSAGIPFIVRWPKKISPKVIETPYSSVDLYPTLLGLIGVDDPPTTLHGVDASTDLLSEEEIISDGDKIVFTFDGSNGSSWAAAVMKGYKLVISSSDVPWLFDLNRDPDEMINFFSEDGYSDIVQNLQTALFKAMKDYKMPLGESRTVFFWDMPACIDTLDALQSNGRTFVCTDIGNKIPSAKCGNEDIARMCPNTCKSCCADSSGKLWVSGQLKTCPELSVQCGEEKKVRLFCPSTCDVC